MKLLPIIAVLVLCIGVIYGLPTPIEELPEGTSLEELVPNPAERLQAEKLLEIPHKVIKHIEETPLPETHRPETMLPEAFEKESQQDALLSADSNPPGDSGKRSKRFIFFSLGWPVVYSYPSAYVIG